MSLLPCISVPRHSRRANAAPAMLAFVCAIVIEALHGHECSGDGCVLCLVVAWANVLLLFCLGIVVARPIIHVFKHICVERAWCDFWRIIRLRAIRYVTLVRPPLTLLSMGVMLRI